MEIYFDVSFQVLLAALKLPASFTASAIKVYDGGVIRIWGTADDTTVVHDRVPSVAESRPAEAAFKAVYDTDANGNPVQRAVFDHFSI